MTPEEKLIQELRRDNDRLRQRNVALEKQHQLDLADNAYQRRLIDFLKDSLWEATHDSR